MAAPLQFHRPVTRDTAIDEAKHLVLQAMQAANVTKAALWKARDEVHELRKRLYDAEKLMATARREFEEDRAFIREVWSLCRYELEARGVHAQDIFKDDEQLQAKPTVSA